MLKRFLWAAALLAAGASAWYLADLPDVRGLAVQNPPTSAIRRLREAQVRKKGQKPRSLMIWRPLTKISPHLAHAVVLAEDDQFFRHHGFDLEGVKHAVRVNWERKRFAAGGSTLTQQLARTLYLSNRKNVLRKAKEALIARRLEKTLKKRRILELYLNVVEWGPEVYGAEAAARYHFKKSAGALTPEEAIALACILPSPRKWSPHSQKRFMARRKAIITRRMVRAKFITRPAAEPDAPALADEPLPSEDTAPAPSVAPSAPPVNAGPEAPRPAARYDPFHPHIDLDAAPARLRPAAD